MGSMVLRTLAPVARKLQSRRFISGDGIRRLFLTKHIPIAQLSMSDLHTRILHRTRLWRIERGGDCSVARLLRNRLHPRKLFLEFGLRFWLACGDFLQSSPRKGSTFHCATDSYSATPQKLSPKLPRRRAAEIAQF